MNYNRYIEHGALVKLRDGYEVKPSRLGFADWYLPANSRRDCFPLALFDSKDSWCIFPRGRFDGESFYMPEEAHDTLVFKHGIECPWLSDGLRLDESFTMKRSGQTSWNQWLCQLEEDWHDADVALTMNGYNVFRSYDDGGTREFLSRRAAHEFMVEQSLRSPWRCAKADLAELEGKLKVAKYGVNCYGLSQD